MPSTNLIGERDFAQLDHLIRQEPSARMTTLEAIIMWTNSKTPEWLDGLGEEDRKKYMKTARKCSEEVLAHHVERRKAIKAKN